jgi:hypothetical protein
MCDAAGEGCGAGQEAPGGEEGVNPHGRPCIPLPDRFWPKVDKRGEDECWEWQGSRSRGYGRILIGGAKGRPYQAHRIAWELTVGHRLPDSIMVLHRCDNPPCVNPAHLFLGTQLDNMRDCAAKGRTRRKQA